MTVATPGRLRVRRRTLPPGPGGLGFRALRAIRSDPLAFYTDLGRDHGDLAWFRLGLYSFCEVRHPDLVEQVLLGGRDDFEKGVALRRARWALGNGLLTSEGEHHARQRRLVAPAFSPKRIAAYGPTIAEIASDAARRWRPGEVVDVRDEMSRITLAIVVATLFGDRLAGEQRDEISDGLSELLDAFDHLVLHPLGSAIVRSPLPADARLRHAAERIDDALAPLLGEPVRQGEGVLDTLLGATGQTGSSVRDEIVTLVLAGHETTANLLAWTFLLLASHGDVEERLHAEIDALLAGRTPTADDVQRLPFSGHVLAEALRLYPPAWGLSRRTRREIELGGYSLPAGTGVSITPYAIHRDPRWWDAPDAFQPDRWRRGQSQGHPRFAYLPFGGGARQCIGENFALVESTIVLATLAQRWRLRRINGEPLRPDPKITLRPAGNVAMRVEAR